MGVTAKSDRKIGMWEELKTRTMKLEKYERDTSVMMVAQLKSIPRMKIMKTKYTKITTSSSNTLTCETSKNIKKVYVNLMPILAAARGPVEKEENTDEEESSASESKIETSRRNQPSFINSAKEQVSSSEVELPPISVHKPAALQCNSQTNTSPQTTLPPIRPSNWNKSGELPNSKPVTDEAMFSVSKKINAELVNHSNVVSIKAPWRQKKINEYIQYK